VQTTCSKWQPSSVARLYRKLVNLEVVEAVLALERFRSSRCWFALTSIPITRAYGPAQSVLGRLGGAAAGDQDAAVFTVGLVGPEEVGIGAPPLACRPSAGR